MSRGPRTTRRGVQGFPGTAKLVADRTAIASGAAPLLASDEADGADPETVIGSDDRVRVTPTTAYPARAVAFVMLKQGGFKLTCTAWMMAFYEEKAARMLSGQNRCFSRVRAWTGKGTIRAIGKRREDSNTRGRD